MSRGSALSHMAAVGGQFLSIHFPWKEYRTSQVSAYGILLKQILPKNPPVDPVNLLRKFRYVKFIYARLQEVHTSLMPVLKDFITLMI